VFTLGDCLARHLLVKAQGPSEGLFYSGFHEGLRVEQLEASSAAKNRVPIEQKKNDLRIKEKRFLDAISEGNAPPSFMRELSSIQEALDSTQERLTAAGASVTPLSSDDIARGIQEALLSGAVDLMSLRNIIEMIVLPADQDKPPLLHIFGSCFELEIARTKKARKPKGVRY
jgi:hypothetical protein